MAKTGIEIQCTVIIVHQWANFIAPIDEFRRTMAGKPSLSLLVNLEAFCRLSARKSLTVLDATQKDSFMGKWGTEECARINNRNHKV